jgi:hypothetical protein
VGLTLIEVSQALPARPSGRCSVGMKMSNGHSSDLKYGALSGEERYLEF